MTDDTTKHARALVRELVIDAHATEVALLRVLRSQIAMCPRGRLRDGLETHLEETRGHARSLQERGSALGAERGPVGAAIDLATATAETVAGQALAMAKAPLDRVRGADRETKLLRNARDACATEAFEIATYVALEEVAARCGDPTTAAVAADIAAEERAMLEWLLDVVPETAGDLVVRGVPGETAAGMGTDRAQETRGTPEGLRSVPQNGEATDLRPASLPAPPIDHYDDRSAAEISRLLRVLSQHELSLVERFERAGASRSTVLNRVKQLRTAPPWDGYDEDSASTIRDRLSEQDLEAVQRVADYERAHRARTTVLGAAKRMGAPGA